MWPYPEGGTISTAMPLASMLFGAEVMYVLMPETGSNLVFDAGSRGLHHISGSGTVITVGNTVTVYAYR